jgi:hypothetical protein
MRWTPVVSFPLIAGSLSDARRLAENRMGAQPPSSFSGSGPAYGRGPLTQAGVADTDRGFVFRPYGQTPTVSPQAQADIARQQVYGGAPSPALTRSEVLARLLAMRQRRGLLGSDR